MNEGADLPSFFEKLSRGCATGCTGSAGDKKSQIRHLVVSRSLPVEGIPVQNHELLHGHRPLTGNCGDDLVFAREDAVLIIEGDGLAAFAK
jgi:hypothetical protein